MEQPRVGIVTTTRRDLEYGPNGGTFRRRRETREVDESGVDWVCAVAKAGAEFRVADDLAAIGFRVFAPHGVRVCRRARVGPNDKRATLERDYPVFDRYVFVGQPPGLWLAKRSHPHILALVAFEGATARVPSRFVRFAADLWLAGEWDQRRPLPAFTPGAKVRVKGGAFQGCNGVFAGLRGELLAVVEMAFLGSVRQVGIDSAELEAV